MATVVRDVASPRAALGGAETGLVPTMGALHAGHLSLIRRAAAENERTVVSVFVNPTQFSDPLDLARYPRDLDRDVDLATSAGADLVYAPPVEVVYPPGFAAVVDVAGLTEAWEGASRPGHFRGVATVVSILLNSVRPARTYFGEKDFQQLVVVRRLHRDLVLPGEIVGCPTVRDEDGLALSSRNVRLSPEARQTAVAIPRAMFAMRDAVGRGVRSIERLLTIGRRALTAPGLDLDYLAVVDAETLAALPKLTPGARAIVAATVGGVRLIDNVDLGDG
ncbi:MAG: pantoate--beta-alanine ligase [Thermomicrobiales bacterium]